MELGPLRTMKEEQNLNGKIAALNKFVSKVTEKCLPFFRTLRKSFEWTDECHKVFEDLKKYLSSPPLFNPVQARRRTLPLHSGFASSSQCDLSKRRGRIATARLFYKQGIPRSGRKIPQDGEVGLCTYNNCVEAQTIFPGPHHRSSDEPTFEKRNKQPRGGRKDGLMGN